MQRVSSFFPEILREVAANEELCLIFLKELWPQMVGQELAKRAQPLRLQTKTLTLAVPSDVWKKQLMELRHMLVDSVNRFWNARIIEKIHLEIHPNS